MKRIFLIGYMGVGKTTVGKELAKFLDMEFVDLDHFIQNRYSKTVNQLFEEFGEEKFREIEKNILEEVAEFENVVISTGGGAPCFYNNMDVMNQAGITVYLKADPYLLSERLNTCKEKRPLIKDKNEEQLLEFVKLNMVKREPYYSQAQIVFETDHLVSKEDSEAYIVLLTQKLGITKDEKDKSY